MNVFGDTTPYHDKQPLHAFVRVYVADHLLASKNGSETTKAPEYIQSFEFNKLETSGTYTLVLFDKNWTELEQTFIAGATKIKILYGFVTGKQSPLYEGYASDYTVSYTQSGVVIGINGALNSALQNNDLMTMSTGTTNPTEAVKSICSKMGYQIGNMDETNDVSLPNNDYFNLIKDHPVSYINLSIAPYAVRKADGMSGFRFIVDNSTSPPTAHFLPLSAQNSVDKTYVCEKGINSSVISFEVQAKGVFGSGSTSTIASNIEISNIDPVSGEVKDETVNITNSGSSSNNNDGKITITGAADMSGLELAALLPKNITFREYNGQKYFVDIDQNFLIIAPVTNDLITFSTNEAVPTTVAETQQETVEVRTEVATSEGQNAEMAVSAAEFASSLRHTIPYEGVLTIIGDPSINVGDTIRILVPTSTGDLHYSSGIYFVQSVVDSITSGKYYTVLNVVREPVEDDVQIVDYRKVVK